MLSDCCGLSTVSKAGNKSISRTVRVIQMLAKANLIECDGVWDKYSECWLPKFITVTPAFFELCGIAFSEVEAYREKKRNRANLGYITNEELATLSNTEIKKLAKINHIRAAFNHRKEKVQARKKAKLKKRLDQKSYNEKRTAVGIEIIRELERPPESADELNRLINQRLAYYEKVRASFDDEAPPNETTRH